MNKRFILISIIVVVWIYLVTQIYLSQIIEGNKYLQQAIANNYSKKIIIPQRGLIYDANNEILAENSLSYSIMVDPTVSNIRDTHRLLSSIRKNEIFKPLLSSHIDADISQKKLQEQQGIHGYILLENLDKPDYDLFFNTYGDFRGLVGIVDSVRLYPMAFEFAHILGYVGYISDKQNIGVKEGKTGIEGFYDKFLQGKAGESLVYKTVEGKLDETVIRDDEPGDNVYLTIDKEWQLLLYQLLVKEMEKSKANSAAAVILDSDSGQVKAMISLPSFDSNLFNVGISQEAYTKLTNDIGLPLINKVISAKAAPGSTFKPMVALFALNEKVINDEYTYISNGCEELGGGITFCEADKRRLGEVGIYKSIFSSSNLYYCSIAKQYVEMFGNQDLQYFLDDIDAIGGVELTGIDLPGEISGVLPSYERTQKNYARKWSIGDMCNTFIGQGDLTITPLRLAVWAAFLNSGGKIVQPYIMEKIVKERGSLVNENLPVTKFEMKSEYFKLVTDAMKLTISEPEGSARILKGLDTSLRVKTGSADAQEKLSKGVVLEGAHSWIMGGFDYKGNNYSFAIVQFYGGRGYQTVPVIGNFVNCLKNPGEKCQKY